MADYYSDLPPLKDESAKPGTVEWAILQWCEDRLKQGRRFVEASPGYDRIERALDGIFSEERQGAASYVPTPKPLSSTRINLIAKTAEDLTAQLTDMRVFWNYSTHNPRYEAQASLLNKQAEDWYTGRLIDLRWADCVRYYTVAGTGFLHLYYSRRLNDMMVEAEDPRHVFPVEPISYHTVQDALGVIVRRARTPGWVKAEYDKDVTPDIGDPGIFGWFSRVFSRSAGQNRGGPLSKKSGDDEAIPSVPTVFVNTMYLDDKRINKSSKTVFMGEWTVEQRLDPSSQGGTTWSYRVPPGQPLYPFKRMIVWTTNTLLYDGPSPYWHSKFPLIKMTLNPWSRCWLGKAPLWDVLPLNQSMNSLLRVIDDHAAQVAQPGMVADRNVSRTESEKFNTRAPGWKVRTNLASGKGIQIVNPPPLDQSLWQHVNWLEEKIKLTAGTADPTQLMNLGQLPSDDTIDTLMKAMTPQVRLRSRYLEGVMLELAEMYMYCCAQFDTLPKRLAKFGPSAATTEDFDYKPGSFIPDSIPDGAPGDIASTTDALGMDNPQPSYQRAREMFKSFVFTFKKTSLLNSAAVQDRMEDLMLSKMGYLSVFTLMENLGRMNFAPPSLTIPNSEMERLQLQSALGIGMIANAQGRKATDQAPPTLSDSGGGDVTLQTS